MDICCQNTVKMFFVTFPYSYFRLPVYLWRSTKQKIILSRTSIYYLDQLFFSLVNRCHLAALFSYYLSTSNLHLQQLIFLLPSGTERPEEDCACQPVTQGHFERWLTPVDQLIMHLSAVTCQRHEMPPRVTRNDCQDVRVPFGTVLLCFDFSTKSKVWFWFLFCVFWTEYIWLKPLELS